MIAAYTTKKAPAPIGTKAMLRGTTLIPATRQALIGLNAAVTPEPTEGSARCSKVNFTPCLCRRLTAGDRHSLTKGQSATLFFIADLRIDLMDIPLYITQRRRDFNTFCTLCERSPHKPVKNGLVLCLMMPVRRGLPWGQFFRIPFNVLTEWFQIGESPCILPVVW